MLKLIVNGKERELRGPVTLQRFLEELGVNTQFVAVALNGDVLDKGSYAGVVLKDGDALEIVRPVGGGTLR